MLPFDPLQSRREASQEEYRLRSEKLLELRRNHAISADAAIQFQLKKQIAQAEAEQDELAKRIDELDRVSEDGQLYLSLLKLGYNKQTLLFRKFVRQYPVAAFLIYGKLDYGQRWLLNRLVVQHTRDSIAGKVIKINLARVARRSDVAALWRELGTRVGLGRQGAVPEIIERIYQWWQSQNVLLVFYEVDFLPEAFLGELLRNFWGPLANRAWEMGKPESPYRLLMFLVDYDGRVGDWSIPFAEQLEANWQPKMPIKLPAIGEFTESELLHWLQFSSDDLPLQLVEAIDETVEKILENSDNGVPEPTFGEICRWAGSDWYENEDKWMKL